MRPILLTISLLFITQLIWAQPTAGTTGLLNTPTAAMQKDGTLMFGAHYLPVEMTPDYFSYNTGTYYGTLTFLPFLEASYRCTLLKGDDFTNQDRSVALRLRLLREKKIFPSIVFGGNDIHTTCSGGNQYLKNLYGVATKTLSLRKTQLEASLGYGFQSSRNNQLEGFFGGLSLAPGFLPQLKLIAEYDTHTFNAGGKVLILKHLEIVAFAYDMKHITGGVAYKIYLNGKP